MAVTVKVPDMMCENCAASIRAAVGKVAEVGEVTVTVADKSVATSGAAPREQVIAAIRAAGFKPEG